MLRSKSVALALLFAASSLTTPAHADIPPPDACTTAGSDCDNAGEGFDEPGTCVMAICLKGPPGEQVEYECLQCQKTGGNAGAGGGGGAGAGGEAPTPGGAGSGGESSDGGTGALPPGGSAGDANPGTGGVTTTGGTVSSTGGKPTSTGGQATAPPKDDDGDDGCSVGSVGTEGGLAGLMLFLGAALLLRGRRR